MCRASRWSSTIPPIRKRRCCGITTTRWELTDSIFSPGFLGFSWSGTNRTGVESAGGKYEIPLVIYDRTFDENGQLDYPVSGIANAPWVPEFRGNTVLVNGKIFPYLEVEPRKYRFRILNRRQYQRILPFRFRTGQPLFQIGTDTGCCLPRWN